MPQAKPKPSEIAAEAKKTYIPYIHQHMTELRPHSFFFADSLSAPVNPNQRSKHKLKIAVIDGDPVDVAIDWYDYTAQQTRGATERIPVVNMANEKRAGGDWESGLVAPEECFSRRSNLVQNLKTPGSASSVPHYPIPQRGGIYSPHVVVFRGGPEHYELWREFKHLPVISVAPVRRPKLSQMGTKYSFDQEKALMMEKMRTVLRIAAWYQHKDICIGAFGIGPIFRNPAKEVAEMWRWLFYHEDEFSGAFENVVFAIGNEDPESPKGSLSVHDVFNEVFAPSNLFRIP